MTSIHALAAGVTLAFSIAVLPNTATAHRSDPGMTQEQAAEVRLAVARLKAVGLPPAIEEAPNVDGTQEVLVSDAVSVIELAHVDFDTRSYFLSVQNPWKNHTQWYGPFSLDLDLTAGLAGLFE